MRKRRTTTDLFRAIRACAPLLLIALLVLCAQRSDAARTGKKKKTAAPAAAQAAPATPAAAETAPAPAPAALGEPTAPASAAETAPASATATAPASAAETAPAAPAAPAADAFDFDLDDKPKATDAEAAAAKAAAAAKVATIDRQVRTRRRMLIAHQALGFATLGVMAATLVIGQLNYNARYGDLGEGRDYDRFQNAHIGLAASSSVMFAGLGILGVAAPNPYPKPIRADTALFHKVTMALATAGMLTQLILGPITTAYEGSVKQRDLALGHVITGYATWGFMAAGVIAYTF